MMQNGHIKAQVNNPSDDHVVIEPELTTEPEGPNTEATFDETPPSRS